MKRFALRLLVVSVALSAALGCWAVLVGDFGETQAKILLTTLTVSGASILAMACAPAWDRPALRPLARIGVGLAVVTAALLLTGLWGEVSESGFWKTTGTLSIVAVSVVHASLVSLVRLVPARRWISAATLLLNVGLTLVLIAIVWSEPSGHGIWRAVGVLSILLCAGTILVPVLRRMARGTARPTDAAVEAPGPRFCVACGAPVAPPGPGDLHHCAGCGARFRAELVR